MTPTHIVQLDRVLYVMVVGVWHKDLEDREDGNLLAIFTVAVVENLE